MNCHKINVQSHDTLWINDNFWQAISVFMFQGECTVNLNNLFSKPSTPILTWTNPRQSFLGNYDYASHFTYDNSSVSVRFHFLDLHLPSSASVWSVYLGLVPCKLVCLDVNVFRWSYVVVLGGICPSPLISCMYCTFDVLYISTASLWYCLSGIPYGNKICPVPTSISWIHC